MPCSSTWAISISDIYRPSNSSGPDIPLSSSLVHMSWSPLMSPSGLFMSITVLLHGCILQMGCQSGRQPDHGPVASRATEAPYKLFEDGSLGSALIYWGPHWRNQVLKDCSDNSTIMAYIRKQGRTRIWSLFTVVLEIRHSLLIYASMPVYNILRHIGI